MAKKTDEEYAAAGLTPEEVMLLRTPLVGLTPEGRTHATVVYDKYLAWVREENAKWEKTEKGKKFKDATFDLTRTEIKVND